MKYIEKLLDRSLSLQKEEQDSCWLIAGREGKGKSMFLLDCIEYLDAQSGKETPIQYIAPGIPQFIDALCDCKAESFVCLDEGRKLASLNFNDRLVRGLVEGFTVMRKKRLITFIVFTNPNRLNTYFREDRIQGLFFIGKRGLVKVFSQKKLLDIMQRVVKKGGMKNIDLFGKEKHNFSDTFPDYRGRLRAAYDMQKDANIDDVLEKLKDEFGSSANVKTFCISKAREFLHCDRRVLDEAIKQKMLPVEFSPGGRKGYIKLTDLVIFKELLYKNKGLFPHLTHTRKAKLASEAEAPLTHTVV